MPEEKEQEGSITSVSPPGSVVADLPQPGLKQSSQPAYRFAWETANRPKLKGPASVADTEGSFFGQQQSSSFYGLGLSGLGARTFDIGSTSNIALGPGLLPPEWSSSTYGLNGKILCSI
jgi:hypothetical protein